MAIREGDLFDGRFRIQRPLGRGGMGEVWAAVVVENGERVAIKVLLDKAARKPDLVARFEREARISARIQSPFVCHLIHAGRSSEGELYIAFELLEGESLASRLRREQDLPFAEVTHLIDDVIEGLVAAHALGVVHRDLKPGNIFLEVSPGGERGKILDFGVSKLLPANKWDERSLTAFDATLGSFAYMAPEQVRGAARADERADIYAVGAVVFRSLSGRLPFEGTTASLLLSAKLDQEAPSLSSATGVRWPAGIERFLSCALHRKREERFASAEEALEAWRELTAVHLRVLEAGRASSNWQEEDDAPPVATPSGEILPPPPAPPSHSSSSSYSYSIPDLPLAPENVERPSVRPPPPPGRSSRKVE